MTPYELIRTRLHKTMPCPHEGGHEKLGFGDTWARCEDCGERFALADLERRRQATRDHEAALEALAQLEAAAR